MGFFKNIDILGSKVSMRYNMNSTIQTTIGGVISFFTFFLMGGMIFGFGQDFFKRTNPTFIQKIVNPIEYPFWKINNKNLSYAFTLEDINGIQQRDFTLYYFHIYYNKKDINDEWELISYYELNWADCNENYFSDPELFKQKGFGIYLCPLINDVEVGGLWDSNELAFISIAVHRCLEGSFNPHTGEPCSSDEKRINMVNERFFFTSIIQSVLVNPSNYVEPLSFDYVIKYKVINENFLKRDMIIMQEYLVDTDYGWLLKAQQTSARLGFNYLEHDMLSIESKTNTLQFETELFFDKKQNNYSREYAKIQKVAAEVGGVLKLFITLATLITEYFNGFYLNYSLGKSFITSEELAHFQGFYSNRAGMFNSYTTNNLEQMNNKKKDTTKINDNSNIQFAQNQIQNNNSDDVSMNKLNNINNNENSSINENINPSNTKYNNYLIPNIHNHTNKLEAKDKPCKKNNNLLDNPNNSSYISQNNKFIIKEKNTITNNKIVVKNNYYSSNHVLSNKNKLHIENDAKDRVLKELKNHSSLDNSEVSNNNNESNNSIRIKENNTNSNEEEEKYNNIKFVSDRIKYEKRKPQTKIMSFYNFICTSFPNLFRCKKSFEYKYKKAVVKTINGYLNTLISVETLIDSRFILNKLKDVLFSKEQMHLINHIPNRDFETYYTNTYRNNRTESFKDNKKDNFILSLRKHMSHKTIEQEFALVAKVVDSSANNDVDKRIINAYKD